MKMKCDCGSFDVGVDFGAWRYPVLSGGFWDVREVRLEVLVGISLAVLAAVLRAQTSCARAQQRDTTVDIVMEKLGHLLGPTSPHPGGASGSRVGVSPEGATGAH